MADRVLWGLPGGQGMGRKGTDVSTSSKAFWAAGVLLFAAGQATTEAAEAWHPLAVDVWDPPFNAELKRRTDQYVPLEKAAKAWRICTSIPHLKDPYWAAVNFGLIDEAKRLGVGLRLVEAGGYGNLPVQRKQITECMESGADALIVSGISADGVNDLVAKYAGQGKPVIDMINGISSDKITARCGVDFQDMGRFTAEYLRGLHRDAKKPVKVAWFPGPDGAAWVAQGDKGFRAGIKGSAVQIATSARGDTGRATQGRLVEAALAKHSDLDYIVGTTVTANAAVDLIRRKGLKGKVKVLAYYYGPGVHRGIRRGNVIAAPTDLQALQARMSVDLAVRALEGKPFKKHIAPKVIVVDRQKISKFNASTSLPPRGFRPIFSVNDW